MLYFPVVRTKQEELIAVRDLSHRIAASGAVVPVFEPVRDNTNTRRSFGDFREAGMPFCLIVNPQTGDLSEENVLSLVSDALEEYDNYVPTFALTESSTSARLSEFLEKFSNLYKGVFLLGQPREDILKTIEQSEDVRYVLIRRGKVSKEVEGRFGNTKTVLIDDNFNRAARNADYPKEEFFSDCPSRLPSDLFLAAGDYSIVGDHYTEDGGPAYAVALHHIYYADNGSGSLWIRHYVSDRNQTSADPGGKFVEALRKLTSDLPSLGAFNHTSVCDEYNQLNLESRFRGLGYAKRLAIKHHLELVLKKAGY